MKKHTVILLISASWAFNSCQDSSESEQKFYDIAHNNGIIVNEGYNRCMNYVKDWLEIADPVTGLIPQNLNKMKDVWNAHNSAADNYPFMVLTSFILDDSLFHGRMLDMLNTEKRLTSRLGTLPDSYSFSKQNFLNKKMDTGNVIFGTSEYIKDGLLPITEYIGDSPWSDRMIEMLDDLSKYHRVAKKIEGRFFGNSVNTEVNGEMLQTLSRVYWMTGNLEYLNWAIEIADYYLIDNPEILLQAKRLRLRDHGCEIIGGLSELYVTLHYVDQNKKDTYRENLYKFYNRILEIGINDDGMFYNVINMQSGDIVDSDIVDVWGYLYNAYYAVFMVDKETRYREVVLAALNNLYPKYSNYNWENGSADGFADAIESGICFYGREPVANLKTWIDKEIQFMWAIQDNKIKNSGIIEGWHGDGNFARTTILYCLWKTNGLVLKPWREDLVMGTYKENGSLYVSISADEDWNGTLHFDTKRHKELMNLPIDYTRINHYPEWFTLADDDRYRLTMNDQKSKRRGEELANGIEINYKKEIAYQIKIASNSQ